MKKLFATSILLLQMVTPLSYAAGPDNFTDSSLDPSVSLSYKSAWAGNRKFTENSYLNHGGNLGFYYPILDIFEVGLEADLLHPTMLAIDKPESQADMSASSMIYSGVLKLQKKLDLLDGVGVIGGIGVGPSYITFDTIQDKEGKKPYEDRKIFSRWNVTVLGDLALSFAITDSLFGYLGYSFQYSNIGSVTVEQTVEEEGKDEEKKEETYAASYLLSHAIKVGVSVPLTILSA